MGVAAPTEFEAAMALAAIHAEWKTVSQPSARELFDQLYSHGVLVRDVSAYPLLDRCLRVSVGTPEENGRFLAALDSVLEKK